MFLQIIQFSIFQAIQTQTNFCTNGKNPMKIGNKQTLLEFSQSPCSPVMLVPGIQSTKLTVEIDCEVFKLENPEVFKTCGWTHCDKQFWEVWKYVPKREYDTWIPSLLDDVSIFTFSESKNMCWAFFSRIYLDYSKDMEEQKEIHKKGYKIRLFGNTEQTKKQFECGNGSIKNLLNFSYNIQFYETQAFKNIQKQLNQLGYVPGLTYQSLPYDFTQSIRTSIFNQYFENNLIRLYELTRKKVTIVAHSLGNLNVLYQLHKFSQEFKDKYIEKWIIITPPFFGSMTANLNLLGGDDAFLYLKHIFGLEFKGNLEGVRKIAGIWELIAKDPFTMYKGQKWLNEIQKRMNYEEGKISFKESGFLFLPKNEDLCTPKNFKYSDCKMGFIDTSKNISFKIDQKNYKINESEQMFKNWDLNNESHDFYKITRNEKLDSLTNPGVPLVYIISRSFETIEKLEYDFDLFDLIKQDVYGIPKISFGKGDSTVSTTSAIIPALKWAYEYEQKLKNAKPVKIVDYCSFFNEKYSPFDLTEGDKPYEILKNEFFGIQCDCISSKNQSQCIHASIISDSYIIKLLQNSFIKVCRKYR